MFQELIPIIATSDPSRALSFYRDQIGFEIEYAFPDDGAPEYIGLRLGPSQLGIARDAEVSAVEEGDGAEAARFSLWVYVDDCDRATDRLRQDGTRVIDEPADQPWGERVATVLDPDGNRVFIGARSES